MSGYLQRLALSAIKPGGSLQPVLGSVFSPPPFAGGLETASPETTQPAVPAAPSEFVPKASPRPSHDDPGTPAFEAPEPDSKSRQSAEVIRNLIPAPLRSFTPLVPASREEKAIAPLVAASKEEKAKMLILPLRPAKCGEQLDRDPARPRQEATAAPLPKQTIDGQEREMAPAEVAASQVSQKAVATTFRPLNPGADGRERMGTSNMAPARREPDEIQIHIGRIEVVAVPPARQAPPKPRRGALSLDEFLRRRAGRAV